ncbi:ADP-ribosylglycohydrolase family protein [Actinopolymorpha alba]|uniref:ADP-ribosylglycohydrolase family protein n=1 Tax=Actinopolymorpha alba TaxID=533267 RepID=UPI00036ED431|nr:ADP-ribosylglycohydrolase family protein [Actinopolymorpha alba]
MRLTWIQPPDLVGHALHRAELARLDVAALRAQWVDAGGDPRPLHAGASDLPFSAELRALAERLLDELDALPSPYADREPTDLPEIAHLAPALRDSASAAPAAPAAPAAASPSPGAPSMDRYHGAWLGRAAGCLLGKPVEKIPRRGIREILQSQGRWPLHAYFTERDLPAEVAARWPWNRRSAPTSLVENIAGMPEDDDLNFPLLNLALLEDHGASVTTEDIAQRWLEALPAGRVFTAERVAYRNLLLGYPPQRCARVRNPFQEWIGAQIRGDVFGWAAPGDPARAARLAWRDAVLTHTGNGVYGEMFVAAASAAALVADRVDEVLDAALDVVPPQSRYAEAVRFARDLPATHADFEDAVDAIAERYGNLHWVHVLNNTALVVAALAYGDGDYSASITHAVSGGWDTDSNGATVGSIVGALTGARALPQSWISPLDNRLASTLAGFDGIGFDVLAARTKTVADRLRSTS